MKNKTKSFTLIELIVVVIILGILAAVAIPIYTGAVEQRKGEACINNIRTILAAWQIYNMRNGVWDPDPEFQKTSDINTQLNTFIDERNFGQQSGTDAGFNMEPDETNHILKIYAYRLSGAHDDDCIACSYNYETGTYNWVTDYTWDWPPS